MYEGDRRLSRQAVVPARHAWCSGLSGDHPNLPALVPSPVREESVVIAFGTRRTDRDLLNAGLGCVLGDKGPQIHVAGSSHRLASQLFANVSAGLEATTTDCRAEGGGGLGRRQAPR